MVADICTGYVYHVAVTRDNGIDVYCMKSESRIEGPYEFGVKPKSRQEAEEAKPKPKMKDIE